MKKYSIVGILSILVLVGCISLFQLTENLNEQIFSGVLQNITLKEGTTFYTGTWTLKMEKITNTGYLYSMNIDNTLKISFNTKKEIKIEDIMTGELQNTHMSISSIPLVVGLAHRYHPLSGTGYNFRANFSGEAEIICDNEGNIDGVSFPSGSGELSVKGYFSPDMTYPYINRFSGTVTLPKIGEIFPGIWSEKFDRDINSNINPNHRGKDDCLVEIGTSKQITKDVPIQFSSGFDDYIFAITKKKSATSHCRELLLYDYHLLFRHQKMFCVVKMNASTKIKDIQLVK